MPARALDGAPALDGDAPARRPPWLFGAAADAFFLGPGATLLIAPAVLALEHLGARAVASAITLALASICVGPHYAATYRRAYGSREILRAHPWVTLGAPPLLLGLGFLAVRHPDTLGLGYFAAYVGWSGYHYSGQSLGLAMIYA